jgi:predicted metal-dependent hydrolase
MMGTAVPRAATDAPEDGSLRRAGERRTETELAHRRIAFEYPPDFDPMWAPQFPEFAAAANGISLGMPYAEPQFIRAVTSTFDRLDPELRARTEAYVRQETGHFTQHACLNAIVTARYPGLRRVERLLALNDAWVERRSPRFKVAYAASGETISYGVARWTEAHLGTLMDRSDPVAATLFCWHLAEEIEHKSSTYDVFEATDGSRLRYAWTAIVGFVTILFFTFIGALVQMHGEKRLRYPVCWYRLIKLGVSVAFEVIPTLVVSSLPGHHPSDFVDPIFLPVWLGQYDPVTGTMPLWRSHPGGPTTAPVDTPTTGPTTGPTTAPVDDAR